MSSTEILSTTTSTWVLANPLPRKISGMRGLSMAGVLYMTGQHCTRKVGEVQANICVAGGSDNNSERDEVIAWIEEDWVEVGKMSMPRAFHAISHIMMDDEPMQFCG